MSKLRRDIHIFLDEDEADNFDTICAQLTTNRSQTMRILIEHFMMCRLPSLSVRTEPPRDQAGNITLVASQELVAQASTIEQQAIARPKTIARSVWDATEPRLRELLYPGYTITEDSDE